MKYASLILCGAVAITSAPASVSAQQLQTGGLFLSCPGSGSKGVMETTTTNISPRKKDEKRQTGTSSRFVNQPIQGTVTFAQMAEGPHIRLFAGLMPPLNIDNAGKWRPVKDYVMTDILIKGRISTGLISELKFEIDRRTGDIQMKGGSDQFSGSCTRQEVSNTATKF